MVSLSRFIVARRKFFAGKPEEIVPLLGAWIWFGALRRKSNLGLWRRHGRDVGGDESRRRRGGDVDIPLAATSGAVANRRYAYFHALLRLARDLAGPDPKQAGGSPAAAGAPAGAPPAADAEAKADDKPSARSVAPAETPPPPPPPPPPRTAALRAWLPCGAFTPDATRWPLRMAVHMMLACPWVVIPAWSRRAEGFGAWVGTSVALVVVPSSGATFRRMIDRFAANATAAAFSVAVAVILLVKRVRRADRPLTNRGDAAAATWIFRGDGSRRRRGGDVDLPWRRIAATPRRRRGSSVETDRGDAAAATWIFPGDGSRRRRGRDVDISCCPKVLVGEHLRGGVGLRLPLHVRAGPRLHVPVLRVEYVYISLWWFGRLQRTVGLVHRPRVHLVPHRHGDGRGLCTDPSPTREAVVGDVRPQVVMFFEMLLFYRSGRGSLVAKTRQWYRRPRRNLPSLG